MPVTSFALLVLLVIALGALTVFALSAWGLATVLPIVIAVVLIARWALAHVPYDDSHP
ncbi:hypothetical protein [Allosediminivita pacifica]|uniref:Uncharacterized protein n=1 Tax=Allosediminivita pacifica TaxID=1267769 RepID=A0A2T6B2N1_9RHOB|nr:hypothetical protein [Allosediminivita pacifica]PTX50282.1 hypothetical protein C8N44_105142 [Allosediminivita pacifica]GGB02885.1 hypothetical protein GCM10011324_11370 [Allosediminivita pacifica]